MNHHWEGEEPKPDEYFGFIYIIESVIDDKKYIGKKQYHKSAGRVPGCSGKITDRKSDKWKDHCWKCNDWEFYTGSNRKLNAHIKQLGKENFRFEIIRQCRSRGSLHYAEIEEQVKRNVLKSKLPNGDYEYFNGQIAGIKFRPPEEVSDKTISKIQATFAVVGHPMQGKQHPNKGKKLSQTRPVRHVSKDNIQITDGTINAWHKKTDPIPAGWRKGITKKDPERTESFFGSRKKTGEILRSRRKEQYEKSIKYCIKCGSPIPYESRKNSTCSNKCAREQESIIRADDKVYVFYNDDGTRFTGLIDDFCKKFKLRKHSVEILIFGYAKALRNKSGYSMITQHKGWRIDREASQSPLVGVDEIPDHWRR